MNIILEKLINRASDVWMIGKSWEDIKDVIHRAYSLGFQDGLGNQSKWYDKGYADGLTKAKEVLKG